MVISFFWIKIYSVLVINNDRMLKFNLDFMGKFNLIFILFLILYLLLGVYLLKYYQYDPISRDLISIMSIGRIYAAGNFNYAINGYWGPLFSWLMIPFLIYKSTPQFALYSTKLLALIIGFFTMVGIRFLSYRFEIGESIRASILFSSIFIILYFALRFNPVDLLLACFLIYYLYFIFNPNYSHYWYSGLICGFLGALAFLTKSFALPFFILHFILFNRLHYLKNLEVRRGVIKNLFIGFAVFFIISGLWTGIISEKYNYLTFGTSGKYNFEEIGPIQQQLGSPIWHGFLKPSNEMAVSAWEDPTYLIMSSWNPLNSWALFNYELNIIRGNIMKTLGFLYAFTILSLFILLIYFILLIRPFKKLISNDNMIIYPLLTIIVYIAIYIPIFVEFRYFFIVYFLLILMGGYLLQQLFNNQFFTRTKKYMLLSLFIISLLVLPATSLIQDKDSGKGTYELANTINSQYNIHGNIASNNGYIASMFLTYLWNSHYYGTGTSLNNWNSMSNPELENNLTTYNIDYYLVWGDSNNNSLVLSKYKEITDGKIKDLKIYSIKEEQ